MKSNFKHENGHYWYNGQRCVEVKQIIVGIVTDHFGDRAGSFDYHDSGYIFGKTLGGDKHLLVEPLNFICPTCKEDIRKPKNYCANYSHSKSSKKTE